ncbi:MAG TPA: DUF1800 domain-containing protein [Nitrospira sp.]
MRGDGIHAKAVRHTGCWILVFSIGAFFEMPEGRMGPLAFGHDDLGRHTLVKPTNGSDSPAPTTGTIQQEVPKDKRTEPAKPEKKARRLIRKPQSGSSMESQTATQQADLSPGMKGGAPISAPAGVNDTAPAGKSSVPGTSVVPSMAGVTTVVPTIPFSSGAAAPSGIAAGAASSSSMAGAAGANSNAPKPLGRSLQMLMQQTPGLSQLITGVPSGPVIPAEPIVPPPPPLAAPPPGLPTAPVNWFAYHVVNRLTYGGTPNQLNMVASLTTATDALNWATAFMKEQLELDPVKPWPTNLHNTSPLPAPVPIQDIANDILISQDKADWRPDDSDAGILSPDFGQLQDHDLLRKMNSRRQLKEKMTYFWDNHFNTNFRTHGKGQYELQENEAFRARAFGNFLDLLMASGKSAAMMIYLNTDVNVKENPNENYAREVLELHTLGVTDQGTPNGYTQADIVDAAKAFTGWDNTNDVRGGFRFVSSRHSPGSKTVLGQSIAFNGGAPTEGEQVLTLAARHPSTAHHLAKQLCEYFVSDTPSTALINEIASVFSDSGGDIKKVLIAIFTSADFMNVVNYRAQVKTPLEFLVGLYRNLGVWSSRDPFRTRLVNVGQSIYEFPPPTGFKESATEWLNTNVLFHETSMAFETTISGFGSSIKYGSSTSGGSIRLWMDELKLTTEEQILGFLTNLTVDRQVTSTEYQLYLSMLRAGLGGNTFDIKNPSREDALDRTLATILTNPRYLYQ